MVKLPAPTPPLPKSGLSYNCACIRVIFVCQAPIRYQTGRTKINPKEQRQPGEAPCVHLCKCTWANLRAGHCPRFPRKGSWGRRRKCTAFGNWGKNRFLVRILLTPVWCCPGNGGWETDRLATSGVTQASDRG